MTNYISNINNNKFICGENFDDRWFVIGSTFLNGYQFSSESIQQCDLSSYLPNDNYIYMVSFGGYGRTPSGSGKCVIRVLTGKHTYNETKLYGIRMMMSEYHSTSTYSCSGNILIPVFPEDRWVTVANASTTSTGNCGFLAIAYRRLGLNN